MEFICRNHRDHCIQMGMITVVQDRNLLYKVPYVFDDLLTRRYQLKWLRGSDVTAGYMKE